MDQICPVKKKEREQGRLLNRRMRWLLIDKGQLREKQV